MKLLSFFIIYDWQFFMTFELEDTIAWFFQFYFGVLVLSQK